MNKIDSSAIRHSILGLSGIVLITGKKPSDEVDGGDGHSDAEKNSGENFLRASFAECKSETRDHDGNKRQSTRDGARERRLQNVDRVFPRRVRTLREYRHSEKQPKSYK